MTFGDRVFHNFSDFHYFLFITQVTAMIMCLAEKPLSSKGPGATAGHSSSVY